MIMRNPVLWAVLGTLCLTHAGCGGKSPAEPTAQDRVDNRPELRSTLQALADQSADPLLRLHFNSIRQVVEAGDRRWPRTTRPSRSCGRPSRAPRCSTAPGSARATWIAAGRSSCPGSPRPTARSPSPGSLCPPAGIPSRSTRSTSSCTGCGTWRRTASRTWPIPSRTPRRATPSRTATSSRPGAGETCGTAASRRRTSGRAWPSVKSLVRVDESRQYLCGHSMGGYGAWHIAHRSADVWAALGIHAGALQYDARELDASVATALRDVPTYFVVGTSDGLLSVNQTAYTLLQDAGNPNLAFVTFPGGHDYRQRSTSSDVPVAAAVREMSTRVNRREAPADRAGRRRGDRPRGRGRRSAAC